MITPTKLVLGLYTVINLNCPPTVIENRTDTWTKLDQDTLNRAKHRCGELYKESPCLKFFRKKAERTYNALCGQEKKK